MCSLTAIATWCKNDYEHHVFVREENDLGLMQPQLKCSCMLPGA